MEGRPVSARVSYFTRSEGPDEKNAEEAFSWLVENCKPLGIMAVPGLANLNGIILKIIGEDAVESLKRQGKMAIPGGEILLITERKLLYDAKNSPILAFYPSSKFLDVIDSIPNASALLVVPWLFKEVQPWIKAWSATELGQQPSASASLLRSKTVEQALKDLTASVNLSTGITHPSDRNAAIQTFEILKAANEPFSPDEVKAWLVGKGGWKATDAQEVAELVQKILEGKKLKTTSRVWVDNILEIWKKAAQ